MPSQSHVTLIMALLCALMLPGCFGQEEPNDDQEQPEQPVDENDGEGDGDQGDGSGDGENPDIDDNDPGDITPPDDNDDEKPVDGEVINPTIRLTLTDQPVTEANYDIRGQLQEGSAAITSLVLQAGDDDSQSVSWEDDYQFSVSVELSSGDNDFALVATAEDDGQAKKSFQVSYQPTLEIISMTPANNAVLDDAVIDVSLELRSMLGEPEVRLGEQNFTIEPATQEHHYLALGRLELEAGKNEWAITVFDGQNDISHPVRYTFETGGGDNSGNQTPAYINQCGLLYQNSVAMHSEGTLQLGQGARLNGGSATLAVKNIQQPYQSNVCAGDACQASGQTFEPLNNAVLAAPNDLNNQGNVRVAKGIDQPLLLTDGRYRASSVRLASGAVLSLAAGDYWIDTLELGYQAQLKVADGVRLFVQQLQVQSDAKILATGTTAPLIFTQSYQQGYQSEVTAYIYSQNDAQLGSSARLQGAVQAAQLSLQANANVDYQAPDTLDFGFVCDLDNDGIYDGLDDDADGDGVTNEHENNAGTDPLDPDEKPSVVAPSIQLLNDIPATVEQPELTLAGVVTAGNADLKALTLQQGGASAQTIALDANGGFSQTVQLTPGENRLVLTASAKNGGQVQKVIELYYQSSLALLSVSPASPAVLSRPQLTLKMELQAKAGEPQVWLGQQALSLEKISDERYRTQAEVMLLPGENRYTLRLQGDGKQREHSFIYHYRHQSSDSVYVDQCTAMFTNSVAMPSSNALQLGHESQLVGPSRQLDVASIQQPYQSQVCAGQACLVSGQLAANMPEVSITAPADLLSQGQVQISSSSSDQLAVNDGRFRAQRVDVGANAELTLAPGDYWIDELTLGHQAQLTLSASGTVRLFSQRIVLNSEARVFMTGPQAEAFVYTQSYQQGYQSQARWHVFSLGRTEMGSEAQLSGAINAAELQLQSQALVEFRSPKSIDFAWLCDIDGDGIYDGRDDDADGDGVNNDVEEDVGSSPWNGDDTPADTDQDGIPDMIDDDIDGDGIDNDTEIDNGTDPYDGDDKPQPKGPKLTLTTANDQTVSSNVLAVTGKAEAGSAAVNRVLIENITDNNKVYVASLSANGHFLVDVQLLEGENQLTVTAYSSDGLSKEKSLTITYFANAFAIESILPASGAVLNNRQLNLSVKIQSTTEPVFVRLEGERVDVVKQAPGIFTAQTDYRLAAGDNRLELEVLTNNQRKISWLDYRYEPEGDNSAAPEITLIEPQQQLRTAREEVTVKATIYSPVGELEATLNGEKANVVTLADDLYQVLSSVKLQSGENLLTLMVTDALSQVETVSATVTRDDKGPRWRFDQTVELPPAVNQHSGGELLLTGQLLDDDVNSLSINGTPVKLQRQGQNIVFEHRVILPAQQETRVRFIAEDDLGNATRQDYYFLTESALQLSWIAPSFPLNVFVENDSATEFAAQAEARNGDESYQAILQPSGTVLDVTVASGVITGTLPTDLEQGDYQLHIIARYGDNKSVTLSGDVSVMQQEDLPLEVVKTEPENLAQNIEPDAPIHIYFNRPIDPAKLQVTALRSLSGKTYLNKDASGTDFLRAKGHQLQQVAIHREPVAGGISLLAGDTIAAFYPNDDLGYNAEVTWELDYNGESILRSTFDTRGLPTLIDGGLIDALGQPRANVEVRIEELGLSTLTNNDGGYAFGYRTSAKDNIPGGDYHLVVNPQRNTSGLGSARIPISIKGGRRNQPGLLRVPIVSQDIPWAAIAASQSNIRLAEGDVQLQLGEGRLRFPNEQRMIHAQFVSAGQAVRSVMAGTAAAWFYQLQPFGITSTEPVQLKIHLPRRNGSYSYLGLESGGHRHALIMGYNPDKNIIEPVGVGRIQDGWLTSVEDISFKSLDYLGYSMPLPDHQALFERYLDQQLSFAALVAQVLSEGQ